MNNSTTAPSTTDLVIERMFNASPELVWQMWTEPEHLMRWWGPDTFTSPECQIDLRVGGKYLFCMQGPDGERIYSTGIYKEIVPYERIAYTDYFSDADGNIVPATHYGLGEEHPKQLDVIVMFEAVGEQTRMTLTQRNIPAVYMEMGVKQGWNESFDKLGDALPLMVTSKDGTQIAYDTRGTGAPVILVDGAMGYRRFTNEGPTVARILAERFTVYSYDRRGRGQSTDADAYAIEREIEDIDALIEAAGGTVYLYGMSSGAILALLAAQELGDKVSKLVLYEPPLLIDDSRPPLAPDYVEQLNAALAAGDRSKAVDIFMKVALLIPEEYVAPMRQSPMWPDLEAVAHTLPYDGLITEGYMMGERWPADTWADVHAETLVIAGEHTEPFFQTGGTALADDLQSGKFQLLPGQGHDVDATVLAPVLAAFFSN